MVYFYKDGQGFTIVYEDNVNFWVNKNNNRVKIYIPGIKTYTKSYIFDNLNQSDVVIRGFYDWMFFSNPGGIYENLINDLGNRGLSKKLIVIQYEFPRQFYKTVSIESLKYFITRLDLVDTYEEMYLSYSEDCRNIDYINDIRLPKSVSKEIVLKLSHLCTADNLRTALLNMVCKNFRELVNRLDRSNKYLISRVKDDFLFKMSTLLIYFKKKKLLKD